MILRTAPGLISGSLALAPRESSGNLVYSTRSQAEDYVLAGQRMALLCAWNGRQEVSFDGRRLTVDDDTWLVVPHGSASVRVRGGEQNQALTILFREGMPEEVLGSLITAEDRLLESGEIEENSLPFLPNLQIHDRSITPVLLEQRTLVGASCGVAQASRLLRHHLLFRLLGALVEEGAGDDLAVYLTRTLPDLVDLDLPPVAGHSARLHKALAAPDLGGLVSSPLGRL